MTKHPDIYKRLKELNITLPPPLAPSGIYIPVSQSGNLLFTSGAIPKKADDTFIYNGKVGDNLTIEQGQEAAKLCIINNLSRVHDYLGDLNKINKIVKMLCFVASAKGFNKQTLVANGASELLVEIFGDAGKHARSAIGTHELPHDIPVEIELIIEIK